jgi:wobble nucleotide-excising tRNase
MKLERFAKIRDHRIFKDFSWSGALEDFGQFNLIYGWNGSGKTTLSNLLRSVQSAAPIDEGQIDFVFHGNRVLSIDLPTAVLPQVRVFNRDSVSRSVFESASGSPGKLPPIYVFGEESAEKQRQVETLKAQLPTIGNAANKAISKAAAAVNDLNEYAASRAREIKNLLVAPGGAFNNYNAADFRAQMERFEANPLPELSPDERQSLLDLKDAKPLPSVTRPVVSFPDVPKLHQEVRDMLQTTVVSNVMAELAADPDVAAWVEKGLPLHTHGGDAKNCKFCDQPLPSERLRRLEAHFNDQFRQFTGRLQTLIDHIESARKALEELSLPPSVSLYQEFQADYQRECLNLKANLSNVNRGLSALIIAVKEKQSRAFESLQLEDLLAGGTGNGRDEKSFLMALLSALTAGLPAFGEFMGKSAFSRLQEIIEKHNAKTDSFAEQVKSARARLHQHELARAFPGLLDYQQRLRVAKDLKEATEKAKKEVEADIKSLEADILQHRQPADELNRELIAYLGHDDIQVMVEDTGYRLTRRGVFAKDLSEGERTTIAFLHFLKSLDDSSFDLASGIVVVDDPISSLDSNSIYSAFGFMKRKLINVGQLFVLTHNFTFFKEVRNWFKFVNRKSVRLGLPARFYMLRAGFENGGRSSTIQMLDPFLRDHESEYHYLFKRVLDAGTLPAGAPLQTYYELPNLARRLLESFLVFKVPNKATLHSRLEAIEFDGPKTTRLIRFLDTHSHAEQIGTGHEEASSLAEAPEILRDMLALMEHCDSGHVQRMKEAVS